MILAERSTCPRCDDRLYTGPDNEPECLMCGYVDYSMVGDAPGSYRVSAFGGGDQRRVRYQGTAPKWVGTTILLTLRVNAAHGLTPAGWDFDCPFCGRSVVRTSLTGKRRDMRQERYVCPKNHRVSVEPGDGGELGWR